MYPRLDNGMQYRLNEINRLKDYFFWQNLRKRNTQYIYCLIILIRLVIFTRLL